MKFPLFGHAAADHGDQVRALLVEAEELEAPEKIPLLRKAVALADESHDEQLGVAARLQLVQSYQYTGQRRILVEPLLWLLACWDREDTKWWTQEQTFQVLWQNKWLISSMIASPDFSATRIRQQLRAMSRRYERAHVGLEPVLAMTWRVDAHVHGHAASQASFEAWVAAERTQLSDCAACIAAERASHLAALGRHEEAVEEATEWLTVGAPGCDAQPSGIIASVVESLLETGRVAQATTQHLRGRRLAWADLSFFFADSAAVLRTCARSGNLHRGLRLLHESLPHLDGATSLVQLDWAAAATLLLGKASAAGLGSERIPGDDSGATVEQERARLGHLALGLAAQFDDRNRTQSVSRRLERIMQSSDLPRLSLELVETEEPDDPPLALWNDTPFAPAVDDVELLSVVELAARSDEVYRWGGWANRQRVVGCWRARREAELPAALASSAPEQLRAVAVLEYLLYWAGPGHPGSALEHAELAIRACRLAGDEIEAQLLEMRLAFDAGDDELVAAAVARIDGLGATPVQRIRARSIAQQSVDEEIGARYVAEALSLAGERQRLDPATRMRLAVLLSAHPFDSPQHGLELLREAGDLLSLGEFPQVQTVLISRAAYLRQAIDPEEPLEKGLHDALQLAREAGEPGAWGDAAYLLAGVLLAPDDDNEEGMRLLRQVAEAADVTGSFDRACDARGALMEQLWSMGEPELAAEVLSLAGDQLADDRMPGFTTGSAVAAGQSDTAGGEPGARPALRSRARLDALASRGRFFSVAAEVHDNLGDVDAAARLHKLAVRDLEDLGDVDKVAQARASLAGHLVRVDALESLREFDRANQMAIESQELRLQLVIARERVQAVLNADGPDAALLALDAAQAVNDRIETQLLLEPELRERVPWDFDEERDELMQMRVRVLRVGERPAEALPLINRVVDDLRSRGRERDALVARVLRGEVLMDLDQRANSLAEFRQACLDAQALGDEQIARFSAASGASRLEELDQEDQARQFWQGLFPESEEDDESDVD